MKVKIKVLKIGPKKVNLSKINFSDWHEYAGMTEEQEDFFRQTYMDYILKSARTRQKRIYFCQN